LPGQAALPDRKKKKPVRCHVANHGLDGFSSRMFMETHQALSCLACMKIDNIFYTGKLKAAVFRPKRRLENRKPS